MTTSPAPWYSNPPARSWRSTPHTGDISAFHRGLPGYAPTPLVDLPEIAAELGVGRVFVKDESSRLGLPAFKTLGASYAISRALSAQLGEPTHALTLDELRRRLAGRPAIQLIAATDGNHGRAVARVAHLLGLPAHIFLPQGVTSEARSAIAAEGAELTELDAPYDETVADAAATATRAGDAALLVQDTSWDGYEDVPRWIVDGYSTLFTEADEQLAGFGLHADLVAVPVGVGSLAQAAVVHYRSGSSAAPAVLSVEPVSAPAIIGSLQAGEPVAVQTGETIMAGLNCGVVSSSAWPVLLAGVDSAITVTEASVRTAVADLQGIGVDAGPCGAATLAGVRAALGNGAWRTDLDLTADAVVLLLSTEGLSANPIDLPVGRDS